MTKRALPLLCPSSSINERHAQLIGVVRETGRVEFSPKPVPLTPEFIETAKRGRDPSKRFRFTSPCITQACLQWKVDRCALADDVTDGFEAPESAPVPDCPIRTTCRWHHQRGEAACKVCPEVIANIFLEEAPSK